MQAHFHMNIASTLSFEYLVAALYYTSTSLGSRGPAASSRLLRVKPSISTGVLRVTNERTDVYGTGPALATAGSLLKKDAAKALLSWTLQLSRAQSAARHCHNQKHLSCSASPIRKCSEMDCIPIKITMKGRHQTRAAKWPHRSGRQSASVQSPPPLARSCPALLNARLSTVP